MATFDSTNSQIAVIPVDTDIPWYFYRISISSTVYTLRLRFNSRMKRWILDIADAQNGSLITSLPLLVARNLNSRFVETNLPVGIFFCVDNTGQDNQPTRFSFGLTHSLLYLDPTSTTF